MTTPKGAYRQRRANGTGAIPRNIREWVAGARRFTFYAHSLPHMARLDEYWQAWLADHPNATPPDGLLRLIELAEGYKRVFGENGSKTEQK